MSVEHIATLKKAASLLKQGNTKEARKLIIGVLRENQENPQAWYLLSFAVPVTEKQIHALQQSLIYRPDDPKVLDRLAKLGGEPLPREEQPFLPQEPEEEEPEPQPQSRLEPFTEPKPTPPPPPKKSEVSDDNLLASRLFGDTELGQQQDSNETPSDGISVDVESERELTPQEALDLVKMAVEVNPEPEVDFGEIPTEEKRQRRAQLPKKIFGLNRNFALIGLSTLIIVVITVVAFGPVMGDLLLNFETSQLEATNTAMVEVIETQNSLTTESTEEAAQNPTPTTAFTPTPAQRLFNLSYFTPADIEVSLQFDEIHQGLAGLIGVVEIPAVESYTITDPQLQTLIWDFSKLDHFTTGVEESQTLYQLLGLVEPEADFVSFYQNFWVDPNGTLVIPNQDAITVIGFGISDYQKYSYAQAVSQIIRRSQYQDSSALFDTYPCYAPTEQCDIANAVIKGDAAYTGMQWARLSFPQETVTEISEARLKYYFTPIFPVPNEFLDELRSSMYTIGSAFIQEIQQSQGWPGVDLVYLNPPKTTEQVLHPEKYAIGELGAQVESPDLKSVLGEEWTVNYQGSLGEWKTYLLLAHQPVNTSDVEREDFVDSAAGWNGDYTQVFSDDSGSRIIAHQWLWDTQTDQREFEELLKSIAQARAAGVEEDIQGVICNSSPGLVSCILSLDQQTVWMLSPETEIASELINSYLPTE